MKKTLKQEDREIARLAEKALKDAYYRALRKGPVQVIVSGKIVEVSRDGSQRIIGDAPRGVKIPVRRGRRNAVRWKTPSSAEDVRGPERVRQDDDQGTDRSAL